MYTEGRSWNWFHVLEMYTSNPYFIRCYFQMPACTCVWVKDTYNAEVLVQILISPFASSECGTNTEEQSSWNMFCLGFQGQRRLDSLPCSSRCTNFPRKSTCGTIIGAARWGEIPYKLRLTPTRGNVPVTNLCKNTQLVEYTTAHAHNKGNVPVANPHRDTQLAPGTYYCACVENGNVPVSSR